MEFPNETCSISLIDFLKTVCRKEQPEYYLRIGREKYFCTDRCQYKVNISNDKAELYEKSVSVKLLVIVIVVFKRYPSTYCLMQGSCVICGNLKKLKRIYLKIRIPTFKLYYEMDRNTDWIIGHFKQ